MYVDLHVHLICVREMCEMRLQDINSFPKPYLTGYGFQ